MKWDSPAASPTDRVIFMDGGKIVEDCPKEQFFGNVEERAAHAQFLSKILQH